LGKLSKVLGVFACSTWGGLSPVSVPPKMPLQQILFAAGSRPALSMAAWHEKSSSEFSRVHSAR